MGPIPLSSSAMLKAITTWPDAGETSTCILRDIRQESVSIVRASGGAAADGGVACREETKQ